MLRNYFQREDSFNKALVGRVFFLLIIMPIFVYPPAP
jgi:hypothetical protein